MRIKEYGKLHIDLKYQSIDELSEWLEEKLTGMKAEKRNRLTVRLLLEEIMLRLREHFGEEAEADIYLDAKLTAPYLKVVVNGEAFNPLSETNAELGDWNSSLQTAVGINPKYSYSWGKNILRIKIPTKKANPVLIIFAALLIGVALGLIGHFLLPQARQDVIVDYFLDPAYKLWIRTLNAISGPIIFFTVITTMLNTKRIDKQGGNSSNVVARYFGFSFLIAGVSVLISVPLILANAFHNGFSAGTLKQIMSYIQEIIPNNIIEPFLDSNTPQLLVVAFVLGAALIVLGTQVSSVKKITRQINMVGLKLAEWVSLLVPIFAGLFLCLEIIEGKTGILRGMWLPFAIALGAGVLMLLFAILYVALKMKVSPKIIAMKIKKPFLTALKTGSLDASFDDTKYSCTRLLGVDKSYADISLPQGLVLYMPVSAIGTLVFTIYSAYVYHVEIDLFWILTAIIFAVMLFVATPPVPGANLLAYVVFFNWLGIPAEALMDAMIFDIVYGIFAGAGNQMLLQVEMVLQAKKIGILDIKKLKKPMVKGKTVSVK